MLTDRTDGKRKAEEEPDSPSEAKRVKHDEDSAEPVEKKQVMKPIPFPEKVRHHLPCPSGPYLPMCGSIC